jgi:hypothetical protein
MNIIVFLNQVTPILQSVLLMAALVGSVFVFKNTRKAGIVKIQSDTIEAQQQQIDALKGRLDAQEEKIGKLEFENHAMREALKDEGILITIDGEKVIIKDAREPNTTRHIIRRPGKQRTTPPVVKKTEE